MAGAGWGELEIRTCCTGMRSTPAPPRATVYSTGEPVHIRDWDDVPPDRYPNSKARDSGLRTS